MHEPADTPIGMTTAVHAGRGDLRALGVHALPIDLSTTYPVVDAAQAAGELELLADGGPCTGNPLYGRLHNPTVARFESAVAELESAGSAVAFATGMAALTAVLLALEPDRRHVIAVRPLYGTSDHLLAGGLLDIEVSWTGADGVEAALRPDTGLVIIESPQNPTIGLVDIRAVTGAAGDVPVLVDNTFATPVLQRPLDLGARLSLHSATKFMGGHGDAMGGVVACDDAWARRLRRVRVVTGALLHPLGAYHLHRGLPTLPLRIAAMQEGARVLARRLASHPGVARVHHPEQPGADPAGLLGTQMSGPGTMLAIDLAGGEDAACHLLRRVQVFTHAVSLGSTDSLIQHPASLTHRVMPECDRSACGIGPGLVRISVGLEHPDDLWRDLEQGLHGETGLRAASSPPRAAAHRADPASRTAST